MALPEISLAQFNRIAAGSYNAGQIDFKTNENGTAELVKINNHVWKTSKNNVELSPERVLEVKEAFLNALQKGGVGAESLNAIRDRLGLPAETGDLSSKAERDDFIKKRFTPLTRAQVRSILDEFANEGRGFTAASRAEISYEEWQAGQATARMSGKAARWRDNVNAAAMAAYGAHGNTRCDFAVTDAISLLSASRPLTDLDANRSARCKGENAVNDRQKLHTALVNTFQGLAAQALKLLPANVRETGEFKLAGETVNIAKGDDGRLSAVVGKGALAVRVDLKMDAEQFVARFIGRAVADAETLGASAAKSILGMFYDRDLASGLMATERTSLTRQFAALVLANKSESKVDFDALVRGNYNTGILVELAERALGGEKVGDTKAALDAYHEKLKSDNADLPEEMKEMLGKVANIPLEKGIDTEGEFIVRAPIVGDIDEVVQKIPPPPGNVPVIPREIGGLNGIKDFLADLVFSNETMVGDATVNKPGEAMRKMLSSDRNIIAFAEIIKNPGLVDQACAQQIADAVKDGLGKMVDVLNAAFKAANNGKELAVAATEEDFVQQFSLFVKDSAKLPGAELAKFDDLILAMANKGCEKIQLFINDVFKVGNANVNAQGGIVGDPYKDLTPDQLTSMYKNKSLNDILDTASNADSPGQVGFFRQVISNYFTSLGKADKRSCFAAAMKYAQTYDFTELKDGKRVPLEGEKLVSAQKVAVNKFTGAILKGTSPLLQKMMQGLPKDIMGDYADALDDMKSALAPIPRKVVQAHFLRMIESTKDKGDGKEIESIELKKSLGAASVGEAFLCSFKIKGEEKPRDFVVKIMRHDAERRVKAEAEIFTAAAEKIGPGMAKTWEGQLEQYMTEFDFRTEAANAKEGVKLYDIDSSLKSMKVSDIVAPTKDVMVAEVASGQTVDKYFKAKIGEIRHTASAVFEQDPATGRIKWVDGPVDPKTGKPKKVPVVKADIPAGAIPNLLATCHTTCGDIKRAQTKLLHATKAWFQEALLGSGKFHGDTHAGNLMVTGSNITFIDFGNLYELKKHYVLDNDGNPVMETVREANEEGEMVEVQRPKVLFDERHELLRVIMGATFRDRTFFLDGLEKLLSPAGKAALAANRKKAEAILDSVLKMGRFSYDVVYRLNAAVVELQKLGLELPPQINCFVQSMARLANTVSEMNTILNQTRALIDAADGYVRQGPAPQRDELDILGMAIDFRMSPEGQARQEDDNEQVGIAHADGTPFQVSAFHHRLGKEGFGGFSFENSMRTFKEGGEYYNKLHARVANAQNPADEARKLADMLVANADAEHNAATQSYLLTLNEAIAGLEAADTPEKKTVAVRLFAQQYCQVLTAIFTGMDGTESSLAEYRSLEETDNIQPKSFASAMMGILMDNFDAMMGTFSDSTFRLLADVKSISMSELGLGFWDGQQKTIKAVKDDALKMAGDNSYQVDIGV